MMFYTTKVICIDESTGADDEIYIGRKGQGEDGYFGNPIPKKENCPTCGSKHTSNSSTLKCYEKYLKEKIQKDLVFRKRVKGLVNKKLVCFCSDTDNCHGSVLIEYCHKLN